MIERPDVDALMAGPLGTWLAEQAQVRAAAREKSNGRFTIAAVVLLPLFGFLWFLPVLDMDLKMFGTIGLGALAGGWAYAPRARAIKQTKEGINRAIADALGLAYVHDCQSGHGFDLASRYGMFPRFHRSSFEDSWSGEVAGLPFMLHEAHLQQRRQSGKNTHYVTVFRGAVVSIGARRRFHSTTLVERAGRHKRLFGGAKDSVEFDGHRLDIVDMVDPAFGDSFAVYPDDQVEARVIVHPAYVERLLEVERAYGGEDVRAIFSGGELVVVVESGNLFESGSLDASQDRMLVDRTIDQFASLTELAGLLNEAR